MKIHWNAAGSRLFETGLDRGVLYPKVGPGVAWNGLIGVNESSDGGAVEPLYFEGVKYADLVASDNFQATIEAFAAPKEFLPSDGVKELAPGLFVTQQRRVPFCFSYRTLIGDDLISTDRGYKIHLVWNCTAAPSGNSNRTVADTASPNSKSWSVSTVPPPASTFKPTAHLVVDSTTIPSDKLFLLEKTLYGSNSDEPYLPAISEVVSLLS